MDFAQQMTEMLQKCSDKESMKEAVLRLRQGCIDANKRIIAESEKSGGVGEADGFMVCANAMFETCTVFVLKAIEHDCAPQTLLHLRQLEECIRSSVELAKKALRVCAVCQKPLYRHDCGKDNPTTKERDYG